MKISRRHLAEVLGKRTLHVRDTKELGREIAAYLLSERRGSELGSLLRDILEYRASKGVVETTVVSAHDLTDAVLAEVEVVLKEEYPKATSLLVNEAHDPEVIGGLRIELANEQLDMTVRRKIDTFKRLTAGNKD